MDDLDRQLLDAWQRAEAYFRRRPAQAAQRFEKHINSQLARPLRAWAMVLRAADTRIDDLGDELKYRKATGDLWLDKQVVAHLCGHVKIDWPGLAPPAAARRLGVSRVTLWRWSRKLGATPAKGRLDDA